MTGTLTTKYKEEMARAHIEPFVKVSILLTSPSTQYIYLASADTPRYYAGTGLSLDPIIISITDVSEEIDPIKRAYQISTLQIEILNDPKIRTFLTSHVWFDADVTVSLGTLDMIATSDLATIFTGRVARSRSTSVRETGNLPGTKRGKLLAANIH